jgi:hypothetical protein
MDMQGVKIPCLRCGTSLPITAQFCSRCGTATVQYFVGSTTPSPQLLAHGKPAEKPVMRTRSPVGKVLGSLLWAAGETFLASIILVGFVRMSANIIPVIFAFLWVGSFLISSSKIPGKKL